MFAYIFIGKFCAQRILNPQHHLPPIVKEEKSFDLELIGLIMQLTFYFNSLKHGAICIHSKKM